MLGILHGNCLHTCAGALDVNYPCDVLARFPSLTETIELMLASAPRPFSMQLIARRRRRPSVLCVVGSPNGCRTQAQYIQSWNKQQMKVCIGKCTPTRAAVSFFFPSFFSIQRMCIVYGSWTSIICKHVGSVCWTEGVSAGGREAVEVECSLI